MFLPRAAAGVVVAQQRLQTVNCRREARLGRFLGLELLPGGANFVALIVRQQGKDPVGGPLEVRLEGDPGRVDQANKRSTRGRMLEYDLRELVAAPVVTGRDPGGVTEVVIAEGGPHDGEERIGKAGLGM